MWRKFRVNNPLPAKRSYLSFPNHWPLALSFFHISPKNSKGSNRLYNSSPYSSLWCNENVTWQFSYFSLKEETARCNATMFDESLQGGKKRMQWNRTALWIPLCIHVSATLLSMEGEISKLQWLFFGNFQPLSTQINMKLFDPIYNNKISFAFIEWSNYFRSKYL